MKQITDHIIDVNSAQLLITAQEVLGELTTYKIDNPGAAVPTIIRFQSGPIGEFGVNGVSTEALLAVVIDRLRGFQAGELRCKENACALLCIEEALRWLHARTLERIRRGVEGTSQV